MPKQQDSQIAIALDLVGKVYEAAAEPEHWHQFLEAAAAATGGQGTVIWLHDFDDASARMDSPDVSFAAHTGAEPEFMQAYAEHYTYTNVWMKSIDGLSEGGVANSSAVVPQSTLHKSEFYCDWLRPQGIGYALGGPILKRGNVIAMFSLLRPERRGPYAEADLRLMQLLMPHLRRACLLHQRLTRLRAERAGSFGALELLPTAVWLINVDGRLQHANRAGRELDARHDGLWIGRDGRPTAADPGDRQRLQRCIVATIAAGNGLDLSSDGALLVRRRGHAQPLQVMLYPLGRDALLAGSASAMFIVDPASSPVPDAELLIALYALTPAEARLACALARGVSVKEYGLAHRVTANTVRTHLKQVLAKTGTTRQSQLVGLVARLPAGRAD